MAETEGAGSFPCPECGGRVDVKDSRPSTYFGAATIRRRRSCRGCGKRFSTVEVIETTHDSKRVQRIAFAARRLQDATSDLLKQYESVPNGEDRADA